MTDLSEEGDEEEVMQHQSVNLSDSTTATDLARHLGQVSLESSPVLSHKETRYARKFSLRELEIQQTIGVLYFLKSSVFVIYLSVCVCMCISPLRGQRKGLVVLTLKILRYTFGGSK